MSETFIQITKCPVTGDAVFEGRITMDDLEKAEQNMDDFELMVHRDAIRNGADIAQELELIFKVLHRMEIK